MTRAEPVVATRLDSFFWIDRKAGIGAVIATQLLPFVDDKVVETILGVEAAVYAEPR